MNILLMDPNEEDATALNVQLERTKQGPFRLEWVKRLSAGLELLSVREFEVILMDLLLPDSSGLESFSVVSRKAPETPVIILSRRDDNEVGIFAVQAGAQDYVIKNRPAGDSLWRIIRHAIERKRLQHDLILRTHQLEASRSAALEMIQEAEKARAIAETRANELKREMEERKKLEKQFLQVQKMETLGTLAGGIAHDLNNQLTPVKGYIDLVLAEMPPADPNYALLAEAKVSLERCTEVIHRLLDFSHASNQKKEIVSVSKILRELKGLIHNFLPSTIRAEISCSDDLYPVEANETELENVLMNMATNARDAMPDGGKLIFEASNVRLNEGVLKSGFQQGLYVLISIRDNGTGIDPENLQRIFEPFFTTKIKGQGTGLGLAMVFKIIRDYGGWVDVSSQLGKGTVFQIYLPAKPEAEVSESASAANKVTALQGNNEMVLFADDEETIRKMGKVLLERLGYRTILAADGEEALNLYLQRHSEIDVVLLDMTMPKLTGKQVLQKILEHNPKACIITASGYTSEGTGEELINFGAMDFLQKPYTLVSLAKSLQEALKRKA